MGPTVARPTMPIPLIATVCDCASAVLPSDTLTRIFQQVQDETPDFATAYVTYPWALKFALEQNGFSFPRPTRPRTAKLRATVTTTPRDA